MFGNLTHDNIGSLHLIASLLATLTGSMVLFMKKGTPRHKQVGYIYSLSMLAVIFTSFKMYHLFGGFGIFHIGAIGSFITLLGGMFPPLFFRKNPQWINYHLAFMYWSVIGLYGAFVSELMVRIPQTPFFAMVGIGTAIVMVIGAYVFYRNRARWEKEFSQSLPADSLS